RFEISGDGKHSIARHVIGSVMSVEVIARDGAQVRFVADDIVMIRMYAKRGMLYRFAQAESGFVLAAFSLGDDDRALRLDFFFVEVAVLHSVSFETQGKVDLVCGH